MLRIAFSTLAARKGGTFGASAAVALAVVLVVSCGILLESSLRAPIPVERLHAAAVVVQADPARSSPRADAATSASCCRSRRGAGEPRHAAHAIPGVAAAVADRTFPAETSTAAAVSSPPPTARAPVGTAGAAQR